jgi:hypothetical protein
VGFLDFWGVFLLDVLVFAGIWPFWSPNSCNVLSFSRSLCFKTRDIIYIHWKLTNFISFRYLSGPALNPKLLLLGWVCLNWLRVKKRI